MQFRGAIRRLALSALVVGAAGALSGCVVNPGGYSRDDGSYDGDYGNYPPARPRDGYRYGYADGLTLVFDSGLGLYSVYGYPDYYYSSGYFYRWNSGYWNRSPRWNQRWERCDSRHMPRPIYYVNNNYYVKGHRPRYGWENEGRYRNGKWERNDNGHGRDRPNDGGWNRDHRDGDTHDGRGGSPAPGGHDEHGDRDHPNGGWTPGDRRDGDLNGDGRVERGERTITRGVDRDEEQRRRQASDEMRDQARRREPVDQRRQPDANVRGDDWRRARDNAVREQTQREQGQREQAAREQAQRAAAERAAQEQHGRERADRQAADQAERAHRDAERRKRDDDSNSGSSDDTTRSDDDARGGARGDNWDSVRRDRR